MPCSTATPTIETSICCALNRVLKADHVGAHSHTGHSASQPAVPMRITPVSSFQAARALTHVCHARRQHRSMSDVVELLERDSSAASLAFAPKRRHCILFRNNSGAGLTCPRRRAAASARPPPPLHHPTFVERERESEKFLLISRLDEFDNKKSASFGGV